MEHTAEKSEQQKRNRLFPFISLISILAILAVLAFIGMPADEIAAKKEEPKYSIDELLIIQQVGKKFIIVNNDSNKLYAQTPDSNYEIIRKDGSYIPPATTGYLLIAGDIKSNEVKKVKLKGKKKKKNKSKKGKVEKYFLALPSQKTYNLRTRAKVLFLTNQKKKSAKAKKANITQDGRIAAPNTGKLDNGYFLFEYKKGSLFFLKPNTNQDKELISWEVNTFSDINELRAALKLENNTDLEPKDYAGQASCSEDRYYCNNSLNLTSETDDTQEGVCKEFCGCKVDSDCLEDESCTNEPEKDFPTELKRCLKKSELMYCKELGVCSGEEETQQASPSTENSNNNPDVIAHKEAMQSGGCDPSCPEGCCKNGNCCKNCTYDPSKQSHSCEDKCTPACAEGENCCGKNCCNLACTSDGNNCSCNVDGDCSVGCCIDGKCCENCETNPSTGEKTCNDCEEGEEACGETACCKNCGENENGEAVCNDCEEDQDCGESGCCVDGKCCKNCEEEVLLDENGDPIFGDDGKPITKERCLDCDEDNPEGSCLEEEACCKGKCTKLEEGKECPECKDNSDCENGEEDQEGYINACCEGKCKEINTNQCDNECKDCCDYDVEAQYADIAHPRLEEIIRESTFPYDDVYKLHYYSTGITPIEALASALDGPSDGLKPSIMSRLQELSLLENNGYYEIPHVLSEAQEIFPRKIQIERYNQQFTKYLGYPIFISWKDDMSVGNPNAIKYYLASGDIHRKEGCTYQIRGGHDEDNIGLFPNKDSIPNLWRCSYFPPSGNGLRIERIVSGLFEERLVYLPQYIYSLAKNPEIPNDARLFNKDIEDQVIYFFPRITKGVHPKTGKTFNQWRYFPAGPFCKSKPIQEVIDELVADLTIEANNWMDRSNFVASEFLQGMVPVWGTYKYYLNELELAKQENRNPDYLGIALAGAGDVTFIGGTIVRFAGSSTRAVRLAQITNQAAIGTNFCSMTYTGYQSYCGKSSLLEQGLAAGDGVQLLLSIALRKPAVRARIVDNNGKLKPEFEPTEIEAQGTKCDKNEPAQARDKCESSGSCYLGKPDSIPQSSKFAEETIYQQTGVKLNTESGQLVPFEKINWTQDRAHLYLTYENGTSPKDTIFTLVKKILNGGNKDIPPISLWVDQNGAIWSHDNRRLSAAYLASFKGGPKEINAILMSDSKIKEGIPLNHLTTKTEGQCIVIHEHGVPRYRVTKSEMIKIKK